jgi:hypothetical protein
MNASAGYKADYSVGTIPDDLGFAVWAHMQREYYKLLLPVMVRSAHKRNYEFERLGDRLAVDFPPMSCADYSAIGSDVARFAVQEICPNLTPEEMEEQVSEGLRSGRCTSWIAELDAALRANHYVFVWKGGQV